jgi:ELWxxDGT repeat protein
MDTGHRIDQIEFLEPRLLLAAALVRDITGNGWDSANLAQVGDYIYFAATNKKSGTELWRTNGTLAGTQEVADINKGAKSSNPSNFTDVNGTLYFVADDGEGKEIFRTNSTAAGVQKMNKVFSNTDTDPSDLLNVNGTLVFTSAFSPNRVGSSVWKMDTKTGAYTHLADIDQTGQTTLGSIGLFETDNAIFKTAKSSLQAIVKITQPTQLTSGQDRAFFTASTALRGRELWTTDGTPEGTRLVKDLLPGTEGSNPADLTLVGDTLFFTATAEDGYRHLWRSDGTPTGTQLVRSFHGQNNPTSLVTVGTTLYFVGSDEKHGAELWQSDGTEAGTRMVVDLNAGKASSSPASLTASGKRLFFTANNGQARSLFVTDGTAAGTRAVSVGPAASNFLPGNLIRFGSGVVFSIGDGTSSQTLWRSNGSRAGTFALFDGTAAPLSNSNIENLFTLNGKAYFSVDANLTSPGTLWESDGTPGGTFSLDTPGASEPAISGDSAYYFNNTSPDGSVFSSSSGENGSATALATGDFRSPIIPYKHGLLVFGFDRITWLSGKPGEVRTLASSDEFQQGDFTYALVGGIVYFSPDHGDLWRTDGTASGTYLLKGVAAQNMTELNGKLSFVGNRYELWGSDGTGKRTRAIYTWGTLNELGPESLVAFGSEGYFFVPLANVEQGTELWKTDGTTEGTVRVTTLDGNNGELCVIGNEMFFSLDRGNGQELWQTDGTAAGTKLVKVLGGKADNASTSTLTNVNGTLYFVIKTSTGNTLWKSDGTGPGTVKVGGIDQLPFNPTSFTFQTVGQRLFFVNSNEQGTQQLWVTKAPRVHHPPPPPAPGRVHGEVFGDLNGDGVQDANEPGLKGYAFYLDLNGNGELDPQEPSDRSDKSGNFSIAGIAPGTYSLRSLTTNHLSTKASYKIVVRSFGSISRNFGIHNNSVITGTIFRDANANGKLDPGESGVSDIGVHYDSNLDGFLRKDDAATITDSNGRFTFSDVLPGTYKVGIGFIDGFNATTAASGPVTVTTDAPATFNIGLVKDPSVTGHLFIDTNGNGVLDKGEIAPSSTDPILVGATYLNNSRIDGASDADINGYFHIVVPKAGKYFLSSSIGGSINQRSHTIVSLHYDVDEVVNLPFKPPS